ncbi:MAG: gliding motility-associated C-terminal domain-containing protein, partial [Flavobacteriales bacterium]
TTGIAPNTSCLDCAGVINGTASIDLCNVCSGGTTGIAPNTSCLDCAGVINGTASIDLCNVCSGGTTGIAPNTSCLDCAGVINGTASIDLCNVCSGGTTGIAPNTSCLDCAGVINGTASIDLCNVCSGGTTGIAPNTSCLDCAGVINGTALPGTACNDNNPCTTGDVFDASCNCAGTLQDSDGDGLCDAVDPCPFLANLAPGDACDDGNPNTINDTVNASCVCMGVSNDCVSYAGSDQAVCSLTTTLEAIGIGSWSGPQGISFANTSDPQSSVSATQPGTYDLYWEVEIGSCFAVDTVAITFFGSTDAAFAYAQSAYCHGDAPPSPWVAQAGGAFTAFPNGLQIDAATGAINVNQSAPGQYTVSYAFAGACPAAETQVINIAANADASWIVPNPLCATAGPIDLNTLVTGTTGGSWAGVGVSNGYFDPAAASGSVSITYTATIGSCSAQSTQNITVLPAVIADAGPDVVVCGLRGNMQAPLGGAAGSWTVPFGITPNGTTNDPHLAVSGSIFGIHAMIWTVSNGACTAADTAWLTLIDPSPAIWVNAGPDQQLAVVDYTTLIGSTSLGTALNWWVLSGSGSIEQPGDSITAIHGLSIGTNAIVLTATLNQCASASDTVIIHVDDLFIPEGFSPNGDGVNDRWEIRGIEAYPSSGLQVFNRWGKLVYEVDAYGNEWEGRSRNGQTLPDDTYFYVLNLTGRRSYNGHVIIKR